jgi:hypothetical protein
MIQEWEGRMNVGMSNSVTTAIRGSIRDTAIGKIRNNEKADRATVEQVCKCLIEHICLHLQLCIILMYYFISIPFQPSWQRPIYQKASSCTPVLPYIATLSEPVQFSIFLSLFFGISINRCSF